MKRAIPPARRKRGVDKLSTGLKGIGASISRMMRLNQKPHFYFITTHYAEIGKTYQSQMVLSNVGMTASN